MSASKLWINTGSGEKVFPGAPTPETIHIEDIARGLSHVCRYTGQSDVFYSVAEHSVIVSELAEKYAKADGLPRPSVRYIAKWGLLHDASEAYIADVSRPVKRQAFMEPYRKVEQNLLRVIIQKFGLGTGEPEQVKRADMDLYYTEAQLLFKNRHPDWEASLDVPRFPPPMDFKLGNCPSDARKLFVLRFAKLWGKKK